MAEPQAQGRSHAGHARFLVELIVNPIAVCDRGIYVLLWDGGLTAAGRPLSANQPRDVIRLRVSQCRLENFTSTITPATRPSIKITLGKATT
jgi:hypothetical protein